MSMQKHQAEYIVDILIKNGTIEGHLKDITVNEIIKGTEERIYIVWQIEYVTNRAKYMAVNTRLTREDKINVLIGVEENHDCNDGITWSHITNEIESVLELEEK